MFESHGSCFNPAADEPVLDMAGGCGLLTPIIVRNCGYLREIHLPDEAHGTDLELYDLPAVPQLIIHGRLRSLSIVSSRGFSCMQADGTPWDGAVLGPAALGGTGRELRVVFSDGEDDFQYRQETPAARSLWLFGAGRLERLSVDKKAWGLHQIRVERAPMLEWLTLGRDGADVHVIEAPRLQWVFGNARNLRLFRATSGLGEVCLKGQYRQVRLYDCALKALRMHRPTELLIEDCPRLKHLALPRMSNVRHEGQRMRYDEFNQRRRLS